MVYKLYYFDLRANAEVTRLILAAAGAKFEDIRVSQEDWPKLKPGILLLLYRNGRNALRADAGPGAGGRQEDCAVARHQPLPRKGTRFAVLQNLLSQA